ncbi:MAG: HicB family protein [Firmicutes bacterium HGW-Firmicutes-9]|nr:MAG: HicB family protein [Firmicutes bacterium HGW-Firmicutes-9]
MKTVFPVVFTNTGEEGYVAHVPDMDIDTQGATLAEAIEMARDAIGLMGIDMQDSKKEIPQPSKLEDIAHEPGEIVSLVDIDFAAYRRANDRRTVRRNVSLPLWMDEEATKAKINVSAVLQAALKQELEALKA